MQEQKFRREITRRLWLSALLFLTGVMLVTYTVIQQGGFAPNSEFLNRDFAHHWFVVRGYYYGVSLGLTFSAIVTLIKTIIMLKNNEKFKKTQIEETDERNVEIIRRAKSISWYVTLYSMLVATFFVPSEIVVTLLCVMAAMGITFAISYRVLQRSA